MTENTDKAQPPVARKSKQDKSGSEQKPSHMPRNSVFFEKIVPAALFFMGLVTVGLIIFAFAVIVGLITF